MIVAINCNLQRGAATNSWMVVQQRDNIDEQEFIRIVTLTDRWTINEGVVLAA